jgi:hypothetical protein
VIQHTLAVKARIQEVPALASKTYVGVAPKTADGKLPAAPFIVIYPADGIDTQERFTGPRSRQHPRFTVHVVGASYENVQAVTALVKAKFVVNGFGVPPAIGGEFTSALRWESPLPIQYDTDVYPSIPYQVIEISFNAEPSGAV